MNVYLESSAVLSWLLGEPDAEQVIQALGAAQRVVTSALTVVECERGLLRAAATGRIAEAEAVRRRSELDAVARRWDVGAVTAEQLDRARRPFRREPVRTLDALHLAAALSFHGEIGVTVVALDERVRENAAALGLPVAPSA